MDYRAAGAAAYLGLGASWAMGLSSSAAQLQANPASIPKTLLPITGVIPFTETIFLWQSMLLTAILIAVSALIAVCNAGSTSGANKGEWFEGNGVPEACAAAYFCGSAPPRSR